MQIFSFMEMHMKISSAKRRPLCPGLGGGWGGCVCVCVCVCGGGGGGGGGGGVKNASHGTAMHGHIYVKKEMSHSWASYQIRKIAGCAYAGIAGNVFPRLRLQRKPLVSDPDMHHGTCVTHVPWCMSGSLNRGGGENVPGIPGTCANRNLTYLARGPWLFETVSKCTLGCITYTS